MRNEKELRERLASAEAECERHPLSHRLTQLEIAARRALREYTERHASGGVEVASGAVVVPSSQ